MTDAKCPPASEAELRTVAMPADTNPYGDIFGGWLLSQMDVAGARMRLHVPVGVSPRSASKR